MIAPVVRFTRTVPCAGAVRTVTEVGSSGAPEGVTSSLASTGVVTLVPCGVRAESLRAVATLGTSTVTVAPSHTGVGVDVSQVR